MLVQRGPLKSNSADLAEMRRICRPQSHLINTVSSTTLGAPVLTTCNSLYLKKGYHGIHCVAPSTCLVNLRFLSTFLPKLLESCVPTASIGSAHVLPWCGFSYCDSVLFVL